MMDSSQREFYRRVVSGPRGEKFADLLVAEDGSLRGPFNVLMCSPAVGDPIQRIGEVLRFTTDLRDDVRELAVLVVAATLPSQFEWESHYPLALDAGLAADSLETLRTGSPASFGQPILDLVVTAGLQMCRSAGVDEEVFRGLERALGRRSTFKLLALYAYYVLLGLLLNSYDVPPVRPGG